MVKVFKIEAEVRPPCESQVTTPETRKYRARDGGDFSCVALANYIVDGRALCRRHAGAVVLDKLAVRANG